MLVAARTRRGPAKMFDWSATGDQGGALAETRIAVCQNREGDREPRLIESLPASQKKAIRGFCKPTGSSWRIPQRI